MRQLAHRIESAAVAARMADVDEVRRSHLGFDEEEEPDSRTLQAQMASHRRLLVLRALDEADWNVTDAARALDVARSYLYKLMQAHGIRRES